MPGGRPEPGAGGPSGPGAGPDVGLDIAGLVPLSTVDWPGRLAAVVFTQGCPWRCGYCQNPDLIPVRPRAAGSADAAPHPAASGSVSGRPGAGGEAVSWADVVGLLGRRRGLLDGVVFSGGEPTVHPGLGAALGVVRDLGYATGLHTGGAWPQRLRDLLPKLDWVGLDIKHLPGRYPEVTGAGPSGRAAWRALRLLLDSGVDHEIRTTVDPTVHTRADILALGEELRAVGVTRWVLQEARPLGTTADYAAALAGRRLRDIVSDDDLPGIERRAG